MKKVFLAAAITFVAASVSHAATIDLNSKGLQLGSELGSSTSLSISDTASFDLGFPIGVIPGFFQALDSSTTPNLALNTGDGVTSTLSVTPGLTDASPEKSHEGNTQHATLVGPDPFAR